MHMYIYRCTWGSFVPSSSPCTRVRTYTFDLLMTFCVGSKVKSTRTCMWGEGLGMRLCMRHVKLHCTCYQVEMHCFVCGRLNSASWAASLAQLVELQPRTLKIMLVWVPPKAANFLKRLLPWDLIFISKCLINLFLLTPSHYLLTPSHYLVTSQLALPMCNWYKNFLLLGNGKPNVHPDVPTSVQDACKN